MRDTNLRRLTTQRCLQDEAGSPEDSSEARDKLENQSLWNAQAGSHRSWLKTLCTALLDSGGVRSEALLLSRPLCLVRTWTRPDPNPTGVTPPSPPPGVD